MMVCLCQLRADGVKIEGRFGIEYKLVLKHEPAEEDDDTADLPAVQVLVVCNPVLILEHLRLEAVRHRHLEATCYPLVVEQHPTLCAQILVLEQRDERVIILRVGPI